jgi:hypothetical protein
MVPINDHKRTLIFLPGLIDYNYILFKQMFIDRSGIIPKDFKIILPQANETYTTANLIYDFFNPIPSWFDLDFAPFFGLTTDA